VNTRPASTHKKVLLETRSGELRRGFLNPRALENDSTLELLDESSGLQSLPWSEVHAVWFVSDWDLPLPDRPRVFARRPRLQGLWIRLSFPDGDIIEGILPNNLLPTYAVGFLLTPPPLGGSPTRVFVPRSAVADARIVGVISPPGGRRSLPPPPQPGLFSD